MQLSGGVGSISSMKEPACKSKLSKQLEDKEKTAVVEEVGEEGSVAIEESVSEIFR